MGRKRLLALLVFLCMAIPVLGASITINATGKAVAGGAGQFDFKMKDGELALKDWLVELKVDGVAFNPGACTINSKGNIEGTVLSPGIPAGAHKIYIKVKLDKGKTVEQEADVTFVGECCAYFLCVGVVGLLDFIRWHGINARGRVS